MLVIVMVTIIAKQWRTKQDDQLSQRDCAAWCASLAKSGRLELGDWNYRSIFNHCDI